MAVLGSGGPVHAEAATAEQIRNGLIQGSTAGEWQGWLNKLEEHPAEQHPRLFPEALQPILLDDEILKDKPAEERRALRTQICKYLIEDHPERHKQGVLLLGPVLRCLALDEQVARMVVAALIRDPDTKRRPAWDRLLLRAAGRLDESFQAALKVLSYEGHGDRMPDVVAMIWRGCARPGARTLTSDDEKALLIALDKLLESRFPDWAFVERFERWVNVNEWPPWSPLERAVLRAALYEEILHLRNKGTDPVKKRYQGAVKRLIGTLDKPEQLREFVSAETWPEPEIAVHALQRAAKLEPVPNAPWADLLALPLRQHEDGQVLREVIAILRKDAWRDYKPEIKPVVAAVAERLSKFAEKDNAEDRKKLVQILGLIGTFRHIALALKEVPKNQDPKNAEVYAALLQAAGKVRGADVLTLVQHYKEALQEDPPDVTVLRTVVDALDATGISEDPIQKQLAATFLRYVLTSAFTGALDVSMLKDDAGKPDVDRQALANAAFESLGNAMEGVPQAEAAAVRKAAIRTLQRYPSTETASVLERIAAGESDEEAEQAIKVLSRQLALYKDTAAADALDRLDDILRSNEKRLLALLDVLRVDPGEGLAPKVKAQVRQSALKILKGEDPDAAQLSSEVLQAVARVLVTYRSLRALTPVYELWREAEGKEEHEAWQQVHKELIRKVAERGRKEKAADAGLIKHLTEMSKAGFVDVALAHLVDLVEEDGKRPAYRLLRARLLGQRGQDESRTPAERRADLEAALGVLRMSVGELEGDVRHGAQREMFDLLRARSALADASNGETATAWKLQALALADGEGVRKDLVQSGVDLARQLIAAQLSPKDASEVTRRLASLEKKL